MADTPWQRTPEAQRPHWTKGPTGWMVQGARHILLDALERGEPVQVWAERRQGYQAVELEYVTEETSHGLAYGWPKGTRSETESVTALDPKPRREQTPVVRKRTSPKTARHKVRRRQRGGR